MTNPTTSSAGSSHVRKVESGWTYNLKSPINMHAHVLLLLRAIYNRILVGQITSTSIANLGSASYWYQGLLQPVFYLSIIICCKEALKDKQAKRRAMDLYS